MSKALEIPGGYTLDLMILPNDKMNEFNEFLSEYGNKPDRYLYSEIARVKSEVSNEVLQQHITNLDAMAKMEGLVTDGHKRRIDTVKRILTTDFPTQSSARRIQSNPSTEFFFGGASLLLWFLALAAIWRRRPGFGPYY